MGMSRRRFHAYKSVAPLKPPGLHPSPPSHHTFPRLQKRGPIEALFGCSRGEHRSRSFPRLRKRGPIEAIAGRMTARRFCAFPRLQKRGPIEARRYISHSSKPIPFPRLQKRGPIEAQKDE